MSIFIAPNTQIAIGNKNLPKEVFCGPGRIFLFGRRIHRQISTVPQILNFASSELPAADQLPIVVKINCLWSRNLTELNNQQLCTAVGISNDRLGNILRKNLEIAAAEFVSHYPKSELVSTPETIAQNLITINTHRRRLANSLLDEMKKQLGGLGLTIINLTTNFILPARLQKDVEDAWRLQKHQSHISDLTQLKLARAIDEGQPNLNLIIGKLPDETNDIGLVETIVEPKKIYPRRVNGNQHSKNRLNH